MGATTTALVVVLGRYCLLRVQLVPGTGATNSFSTAVQYQGTVPGTGIEPRTWYGMNPHLKKAFRRCKEQAFGVRTRVPGTYHLVVAVLHLTITSFG